jgi:hypothetical protein
VPEAPRKAGVPGPQLAFAREQNKGGWLKANQPTIFINVLAAFSELGQHLGQLFVDFAARRLPPDRHL